MKSMDPVFAVPIDLEQVRVGGRSRHLHELLRRAILEQRLSAGSALPSTRRAAQALGIARNSVIAAYDRLTAEGYLLARAGARPVVASIQGRADPRPSRNVTRKRPMTAPVSDARLNPAWRLPAWTTTPYGNDTWQPGFQLGVPDLRLFPFEAWRRAMAKTCHPRRAAAFSYQDARGRPALRQAISQHVAFARAVACDADDVVVTAGAHQAFDLLARLLVTPGETRVAVEEPGYPPLRSVMAAAGARLVPIAVDQEGMRVDQLPDDIALVYVTPSHQFPTAAPMSLARRQALLAYAARHGATIIEDDYDGEFRYGNRPLDALQTLDRHGCVVYVGTFSKSLSPSLRLGYIVAPTWLREPLAALQQTALGMTNVQLQDALASFMQEGHLVRHVRRMHRHYTTRRRALLDGIEGRLSPWLEAMPSEAGIHLAARWRDAGGPWPLADLQRCLPGTQALSYFAMDGQAGHGVVIGFGGVDEAVIADGVLRLQDAWRRAT